MAKKKLMSVAKVTAIVMAAAFTFAGVPTLHHWQGRWWRWDGAAYRELSWDLVRLTVRRAIEAIVGRRYASMTRQVISEIKDYPRVLLPPHWMPPFFIPSSPVGDDWRIDPLPVGRLIALRNGVLHVDRWIAASPIPSFSRALSIPVNLAHPVLTPHTPSLFTLCTLPFDYDPAAKAPIFEKFHDEAIAGDGQQRELSLGWMGYLCIPSNYLKAVLTLMGPTNSGKSRYAQLLADFLGDENVSYLGLTDLADKFESAGLIGKLLNISAEVRWIAGKIEERIKAISGGDKINQPIKNQVQQVKYDPITRLVFITNHELRFADQSETIWPRQSVLHFPHSVPEGRQNKKLGEELKAELPGIFNLAMAALRRLLKRGRFVRSLASEQIVQRCRLHSNPLRMFVEETFKSSPGGRVSRTRIMQLYTSFGKTWHYKGGHSREAIFAEIRRQYPYKENQVGNEIKETFHKGKHLEHRDRVFIGLEVNEEAVLLHQRGNPTDTLLSVQAQICDQLETIAESNWLNDKAAYENAATLAGLRAREERLAKREANPLARLRKAPKRRPRNPQYKGYGGAASSCELPKPSEGRSDEPDDVEDLIRQLEPPEEG